MSTATDIVTIRVQPGWTLGPHPEGAELQVPRVNADRHVASGHAVLVDTPATPATPKANPKSWPHVRLLTEVVEGHPGNILQLAPDRADWLIEIGSAMAVTVSDA